MTFALYQETAQHHLDEYALLYNSTLAARSSPETTDVPQLVRGRCRVHRGDFMSVYEASYNASLSGRYNLSLVLDNVDMSTSATRNRDKGGEERKFAVLRNRLDFT